MAILTFHISLCLILFFMIASILAVAKIILVDLVMSGDNAIIIAMATHNLPHKYKRLALMIGVFGAAAMRIILALGAVYLLQFQTLQYVGGVLLLYVARSFFKQLKLGIQDQKVVAKTSLWGAVGVIMITDISLSLDNVLAVASIADNIRVLVGGLAASVALMLFGSQLIGRLMDRWHWIQRGGLMIIIHTAISLMLKSDIGIGLGSLARSIRGLIAMMVALTYLYIRTIAPIKFHLRKHQIHNRRRFGVIGVVGVGLAVALFVPGWHDIMVTHLAETLTMISIAYAAWLELVIQQLSINRYYMKHESKH